MAVNDEIFKNLAQYGGGTINERVYNFLGSLGYTGTISDRLGQFEEGGRKGWQGLIRAWGQWAPAQLFSQGQEGVWYEPKPIVAGQQVLYQDAAGTEPVTADGDPVGLMLDLHDVDGRGVVNLLKWTEDLTNSVWVPYGSAGVSITPSAAVAPDGSTTAFQVSFNAGDNRWGQELTSTGMEKTGSVYLRADTTFDMEILIVDGSIDFLRKVVTVTTEWQRFDATSAFSRFFEMATLGGGNLTSTSRPARTVYAWHPQFEIGESPTAYQKNGETVGGPGNHATQSTSAARPIYRTDGVLHWLQFDGVDDGLLFSAGDLSGNSWSTVEITTPQSVDFVLLHRDGAITPRAGIAQEGSTSTVLAVTGITQLGFYGDGALDTEGTRGSQFSVAQVSNVIEEVFSCEISWVDLKIGAYDVSGFSTAGLVHGYILREGGLDTVERGSLVSFGKKITGATP